MTMYERSNKTEDTEWSGPFESDVCREMRHTRKGEDIACTKTKATE